MKTNGLPLRDSPNCHPGRILHELIVEYRLSGNRLAQLLRVPPNRVYEVLDGRRRVTAETALRLSKVFGNSARYWLDLQSEYELSEAERIWGDSIDSEVPVLNRAGLGGAGVSSGSIGTSDAEEQLTDHADITNPVVVHDSLSAIGAKLYELLMSSGPLTTDAICDKLGVDAQTVAASGTMLELEGHAQLLPGDRYGLKVQKTPASVSRVRRHR